MTNLKSTLVLKKRVHCGVKAPRQYLCGLDIFHSYAYFPLVLVYKQGLDENVVEKGLIETLKHYPIIAGRFKKDAEGHVFADSEDQGIDFRVHRWNGLLPWGEGAPVGKDIPKLYDTVLPFRVVGRDQPMLQVNVHHFEGGSSILCCYGPHALLDASSYWAFMTEWSKACRGLPVTAPSFDRRYMVDYGQAQVDKSAYDILSAPSMWDLVRIFAKLGWRAATGMTSEIFRIPATTLMQWTVDAKAANPESREVSVGSLICAYVLKSISPALPGDGDRSLGLVRDLRFSQGLGVPRDYFGNAVCYADVRYTKQQLETENLGQLAVRCRPPSEQVNNAAITKMLWLMEKYRQTKNNWRLLFKPTIETANAGMIVNNCVLFPIYEVDMGTGGPNWYEMPPATIRLLLLVQTPQKFGGVDIMLCGTKREVEALREAFKADKIDSTIKAPVAPK